MNQQTRWVENAKQLFKVTKPEHFTNYHHCDECAEHDQTLRKSSLDSITLNKLGHPSWDPLCFTHSEGKKYYFPALIRLCFESLNEEFYFEQLLFHLEVDGANNAFFNDCSLQQREFIAEFVEFFILNHPDKLEETMCQDAALRTQEIWRN